MYFGATSDHSAFPNEKLLLDFVVDLLRRLLQIASGHYRVFVRSSGEITCVEVLSQSPASVR